MNKSMKPSAAEKKIQPLTPEQKKEQIVRFISQKREYFASGIAFNLAQGIGYNYKDMTNIEAKAFARTAVALADALLEELYPLPSDAD